MIQTYTRQCGNSSKAMHRQEWANQAGANENVITVAKYTAIGHHQMMYEEVLIKVGYS